MRILQVLTFGEHIGSYQHPRLLTLWHIGLLVAYRRESLNDCRWVVAVTRGIIDGFDTSLSQLVINVTCRVAVLGKYDHLVVLVFPFDKLLQFVEFLVGLLLPVATKFYHLDERCAVLVELLFQRTLEVSRGQPCHIVFIGDDVIILLGLVHISGKVGGDMQGGTYGSLHIKFLTKHGGIGIFVFDVIVRQTVFVANGQRQLVI